MNRCVPLMATVLCHRWRDAKVMVEDMMASNATVEPLVVKHINTNEWSVKVDKPDNEEVH